MKIVDESILFSFRVFSHKILFGSSQHFMSIRLFIVRCVWNAKSQLQPNMVFWQLKLVTGTSCEFESRANYLARLEVLSCSATAGVTLQLLYMLHTCAIFGDSPVASSSREALFKCILLKFSLHFLAHYSYIILT